MKKILCIILSATLIIASSIACSERKNSLTKIRVNEVTHSIFYAPFYVAIEMGYFKDENIEIELTNGGGADKSMTALLSNSADIGLMGPEAAMYVYLNGKENYPKIYKDDKYIDDELALKLNIETSSEKNLREREYLIKVIYEY